MRTRFLVIILLAGAFIPAEISAQATSFSYQGTLNQSGSPANGSFQMSFSLWTAQSPGGSQVGSTIGPTSVSVANGVFATVLDFGASVFPGADRYLEINVGGTILAPRSKLQSVPYAIRALTVSGPVTGTNAVATLSVSNAQPGITNPSPANLPPAALRAEATATTDSNAGVIGIGDGNTGLGVVGISTGIAPVNGQSNAVGVLGIATATSGKSLAISGIVSSPDGIAVQANSSNGAALFVGENQTDGNVFTVGSLGGVTGRSFFNQDGSFAADRFGNFRARAINVGPTTGVDDTFVVQPDGTTSAKSLFINGTTLVASGFAVNVGGNLSIAAGGGNPGNLSVIGSTTTGTLTVNGGVGTFTQGLTVNNGATINGNTGLTVAGPVTVNGSLGVTGAKNSIVKLPDGRLVALSAMESPGTWFEDFGTIKLRNGRASVAIDKTFAETANVGVPYEVFLTPDGNCRGLYVTRKTAGSFEVREIGGGRSNVAFDYRIVARRKGYENVRFAKAPLAQALTK